MGRSGREGTGVRKREPTGEPCLGIEGAMGPLVASFIPMLESVAAEWRRGQTLWEESCHHLRGGQDGA